ncbi:MAG: coiled-coil domain-containing protein 22 [Synechococcaceae cyanobacterium SM2_3_1]|nr:coiled-coil domain-containing protein 22 [Synechococcaceae cyanobacterium SM2_3_1]
MVANGNEQFDLLPSPRSTSQGEPSEICTLQGQVDLLQLRAEKLRQQILNYELEIEQLLHHNQILEHTIQELPEIYRRKFQERVQPIRVRIQTIQQENLQLRSDVQDLSLQLQQHYFEVLDQPRWFRGFPRLPWGRRSALPALPEAPHL